MVNQKSMREEITDKDRKKMPLYTIGVVADLLGVTKQTLRLYEQHGLIKPIRRNRNRFYSENDVNWLQCVRNLLHNKKISLEGIKKLLNYAPCWEITECSQEKRDTCSAYIDRTKPCWELNRMICKREAEKLCEDCLVFLSRAIKKKST